MKEYRQNYSKLAKTTLAPLEAMSVISQSIREYSQFELGFQMLHLHIKTKKILHN
jgi:hypothetical protein